MSSWDFSSSDTWGGRPVARRLADAEPRGRIVATGTILSARGSDRGGTPYYRCRLSDGTGELALLFLGRRAVAGLVAGARCTVEGTAAIEKGRLVLLNPLYRIEPGDVCSEGAGSSRE